MPRLGAADLVRGLVLPLLVVLVLAIVAVRSEVPGPWLAFMGAAPLAAAMFVPPLYAGIVALAAVLGAGFAAAASYEEHFYDALPVLVGVIICAGVAVLASAAKAPPRPRPAAVPAEQKAAVLGDPDLVDELTGLATREGGRALLAEDATPGPKVVANIDCDHLASVNDSFGRGVGDTFVFAVAGRTRYALTEPDVVMRWDAQQFLVLLHASMDEARPTLELITEKINRNPIRTDSGLVPATMTVGAVPWADGEDVEAAVARARRALYRGKLDGGACLVVDA